MDQKAFKDVLLETVAQAKKAHPGADKAGSEGARGDQSWSVAQKLLAAIKDIGDEQRIEQCTLRKDRSHFCANVMVQNSSPGHGPVDT